jgi:hypothetical protein
MGRNTAQHLLRNTVTVVTQGRNSAVAFSPQEYECLDSCVTCYVTKRNTIDERGIYTPLGVYPGVRHGGLPF